MPGLTRAPDMRDNAPHAAELEFYLRGCRSAMFFKNKKKKREAGKPVLGPFATLRGFRRPVGAVPDTQQSNIAQVKARSPGPKPRKANRVFVTTSPTGGGGVKKQATWVSSNQPGAGPPSCWLLGFVVRYRAAA